MVGMHVKPLLRIGSCSQSNARESACSTAHIHSPLVTKMQTSTNNEDCSIQMAVNFVKMHVERLSLCELHIQIVTNLVITMAALQTSCFISAQTRKYHNYCEGASSFQLMISRTWENFVHLWPWQGPRLNLNCRYLKVTQPCVLSKLSEKVPLSHCLFW